MKKLILLSILLIVGCATVQLKEPKAENIILGTWEGGLQIKTWDGNEMISDKKLTFIFLDGGKLESNFDDDDVLTWDLRGDTLTFYEDGNVDVIILIVEGWGNGGSNQFWPHMSIIHSSMFGPSSIFEEADIDNDGSLDLIVGISTGGFLHYKISKPGDLNQDNNLDLLDLMIILDQILSYTTNCHSDINHNENVDKLDIIKFLSIILK